MEALRFGCSDLFTPRDGRNVRIVNAWALALGIAFVAGTILVSQKLVPPPIGWALPAATAICGIGMLRAYVVFLREADELLRKIQIEGLALGFGVGAVFMLVYRLCERLGAPKLDSSDPLIVLVTAWTIGQWIGIRRYAGGERS